MDSKKYSSVSIYLEDKSKIESCRKLILRDNPQLMGLKLTDALVMQRVFNYFLED